MALRKVRSIVFQTRVRDTSIGGDYPFRWRMCAAIRDLGVDEVCCIGVDGRFVTVPWSRRRGLPTITLIPDGSGHFTRMGMLVNQEHLGLGCRSWRHANGGG